MNIARKILRATITPVLLAIATASGAAELDPKAVVFKSPDLGAGDPGRQSASGAIRRSEQAGSIRRHDQMAGWQSLQSATFSPQRPFHHCAVRHVVGRQRAGIRSRKIPRPDAGRIIHHSLWEAGALGRSEGHRCGSSDSRRRPGNVDAVRGGTRSYKPLNQL